MIHISLLAVLTLVVFGCADRYSSDRPSHHEVYPQVLESISREVDLDHSLAVHPLLAHLDSIPGDTVLQMVSFSRYETHIVPALVEADSSNFHLCSLTELMDCDRNVDEVFLILSEPVELADRRIGVLSLVTDHRSQADVRTLFAASVYRGLTGWRITSFRRMQ